jgi:hypothetical protein
MAITMPNMVKLQQAKSRPPGHTYLGAKDVQIPGHLLSMDNEPTDILIDSGSNISLISDLAYSRLPNRPKPKTGRTSEIKTIAGTKDMQEYVKIPLYFKTKQGPVEMDCEFYVIKNMHIPVIIGTDYQDQYLISINRSKEGTQVSFGDTGRSIKAANSIYSTEEIKNYAAQVTPIEEPSNPEKSYTDSMVRAAKQIEIPAHTAKVIPVKTHFPEGTIELFVQSIQLFSEDGEDAYLMESIINPESKFMVMINRSSDPIVIEEDEILGETRDPMKFLDKEVKSELKASINAITAFFKELPKPTKPTYEPDMVVGGPKIAELEDDITPKEELLKAVNFNPDLTKEQKRTLEKLISKHEQAFGLDDRLGQPDVVADIKIKEGAQPISLPPYHANPVIAVCIKLGAADLFDNKATFRRHISTTSPRNAKQKPDS